MLSLELSATWSSLYICLLSYGTSVTDFYENRAGLDTQVLAQELKKRSSLWQEYVLLDEVDSTNEFIKKMEKKELVNLFNKIIQSFENPKTQQFIELFLGNNGLSKTELETIFPIYL